MCQPHDLYGFKRRTPGAMATYMTYPVEALVHKISGDIPAAHAAFVEPLSCSLHAVERAQITFEDTVVVAGCGPIGLGMIAGARAKNPMHVIALDMAPEKLELAKKCGADVTVDWSIISDDKELDVLGAHLGPYCWPAAIRMIESGVLPMEQICTHQLPLSDFQKGLDLVASGKESVKVSLIPA
jgi:threonine dehydrogenase-like Zn-dependent dehydrogenase